jgi:tetrahydromethanopterin S-methyltransferase subunit G
MNYSDKKFIHDENENHYKLGYKNGRQIGYMLGSIIGIAIGTGLCVAWFLHQASLS